MLENHCIRCSNLLGVSSCSEIRWGHAVNSAALVHQSHSAGLRFLETDVLFHPECGTITAHGPEDFPALSGRSFHQWLAQSGRLFPQWLSAVKSCFAADRVVVKLDFKSLEPVAECVAAMKGAATVWLNADLLRGPRGSGLKFQAGQVEAFLDICRETDAVLSLGWTTGKVDAAGEEENGKGYSEDMVEEMIQLLRKYGLMEKEISFPVRGCDVLHSTEVLGKLLDMSQRFSLTIWVGEEGLQDVEIERILEDLGRNRVFVDVPSYKLKQ